MKAANCCEPTRSGTMRKPLVSWSGGISMSFTARRCARQAGTLRWQRTLRKRCLRIWLANQKRFHQKYFWEAGFTGTAAPAGLAATITTASLAGAAATGSTFSFLQLMSMTKLKIGISVVVVVGAAAGVAIEEQSKSRLQAEIQNLRQQNQAMAELRE